MVKESVVWFLVLAFLNLIITPGFVSAAEREFAQTIDVGPSRSNLAVAAGGVIVLGLIIVGLVYLAKKHQGTPAEQPQEQKQETSQSPHFQHSDEQPVTLSGQIALLRWWEGH